MLPNLLGGGRERGEREKERERERRGRGYDYWLSSLTAVIPLYKVWKLFLA